jgi:molybdate transport system substrate-binding protein
MRTTIAAICFVVAAASVAADEIKLMSAGAVEPGLVLVVEQFRRSSRHTVQVEFGTGPQLTARMAAGQTGDVLIAPRATMDDAAAKGKVERSTRKPVGRVGVGVVARTGGPTPDVSSADSLRTSLLAADAVVFNRGSTGVYVEQLLKKLGVADQIAGKIVRLDNGDAVMRRLIGGSGNEFGFGAITEIRLFESKGARLVAPLPAAVQNFTDYDVAVMTGTRTPQAAAEFVRFITTDAARAVFAGAGVQASE